MILPMTMVNPNFLANVAGAVPNWTRGMRPLDVLLISDDPRWTESVREAVSGGVGFVETVSARVAVARLACAGSSLSHVLVDRNRTDGLLDTLVDMTSDTASADVTLLILGDGATGHPGLKVIPSADRHTVASSLAVRHFPAGHNRPALHARRRER
jgi:hypothetical protein